ncbi:unnamed protein product [Scytosiphon promiscuus]
MVAEAVEKEGGDGGGVRQGPMQDGLNLTECRGLPREMLETGCISEHVFSTMDFLWRASNCLRLTSPAVSRIYSDQLRRLCAEHEAQLPAGSGPLLPEWVSESLCNSCGGVFTPGVNCRVRVRHRSLASPCVKNTARKSQGQEKRRVKKCLNQVVTTCFLCGGINARGGTERWSHDKKRRPRIHGGGGGAGGRADEVSDEDRGRQATGKKRARTASTTTLRGNFIPLGGGGGTSGAAAATPTQKQAARRLKPSPSPSPATKNASERTTRRSVKSEACDGSCGVKASRNTQSKNGSSSGGGSSGGHGDDQRRAKRTADTPQPLTLLERIRRDGKKKRRQDAAAAAAAAATAAAPRQESHP